MHDKATVTGGAGTPTGDVDFTGLSGNKRPARTGTAAGTAVALVSGVAHPSNDATVPAGGLSYMAHYNGDATYTGKDGDCEALTAEKLTPTVVTAIHAGAGAADTAGAGAITSAAIGSTVHDKATVTGGAGYAEQANVDFTVYLGNTTCQGTGTAAGTAVALVSGVAHPSNDATVPAGGLSYIAHYNGDATYTGKDGDCEALTALDANIQITPATADNPINTNHVLTITVNAINGTIDAGPHTATASIVSGPGSFVGGINTCTYTGGAATATCTVTITSAVAGTTVVSATSDIPVNGVTITRTTNTAANTAAGGSGNASKTWHGGGLITDTNVSCSDVLSGAANNSVIGQINYPTTNGTIGQGINPGKFYYWAQITTTVPNQVVTVSQSTRARTPLPRS